MCNESPHGEMARRLGRTCLPAGRRPGSPRPCSHQTSRHQRTGAPMLSARVCASPRPAGGARRQRAPAGLAPAGGLARSPSHAPCSGPGPAVPQPAAQREPGSPGQRAPWPPHPRASSAERPAPQGVQAEVGGGEADRAPVWGQGCPDRVCGRPHSRCPAAAPGAGPLQHRLPQSASGGRPQLPVMGWGRQPAFSPRCDPEFTRPPSPAPSDPTPHGHAGGMGHRGPPGVTQVGGPAGSAPQGASQCLGGAGRTPPGQPARGLWPMEALGVCQERAPSWGARPAGTLAAQRGGHSSSHRPRQGHGAHKRERPAWGTRWCRTGPSLGRPPRALGRVAPACCPRTGSS